MFQSNEKHSYSLLRTADKIFQSTLFMLSKKTSTFVHLPKPSLGERIKVHAQYSMTHDIKNKKKNQRCLFVLSKSFHH